MTTLSYKGHVRAAFLCREWARQRRRIYCVPSYRHVAEAEVREYFARAYDYLARAKAIKKAPESHVTFVDFS